MSDMLSIGASGLRAYQTALTTVSENIANAGTAGYVRRTTTLTEVAATGLDSGTQGMGVTIAGVNRAGDPYRSGEVRLASADLANETLNKRIRNAETSKVPNMLVVGEREQQTESVTLRRYGSRDQETLSFRDFQARLATAIRTRAQQV